MFFTFFSVLRLKKIVTVIYSPETKHSEVPPMNKLQVLIEKLRAELASGKYPVGSRFPSEYCIAETYGVNKTTANKAMQTLAADGLVDRGGRGVGTIVRACTKFPKGLIAFISSLDHPYRSKILDGIQNAALERGYLLTYLSPNINMLESTLESLRTSDVKGIVTMTYGILKNPGLPVIYVDSEQAKINALHSVSSADYQGGFRMMQELIERGHRDIVIVTAANLQSDRLRGFQDAMIGAGIADVQKRIFQSREHTYYDAGNVLRQIYKKFPDFTAIATGTDDLVFRLVQAGKVRGVDLCLDKALTGFGNVPGISDILPIASVDQHPFHIGITACNHVIDMIENGEPEEVICDQVEVELVNADRLPRI